MKCAAQSAISGTIIVAAQSKSRIILAADSRAGIFNDNAISIKTTDDTFCKIVPLGRYLVFAAAGIAGDEAHIWTAGSEAVTALSKIPHAKRIGETDSDELLRIWGDSVINRLEKLPRNEVSQYALLGPVTTAVLAGVEESGKTWLHVAAIKYERGSFSTTGYGGTLSVEAKRLERRCL